MENVLKAEKEGFDIYEAVKESTFPQIKECWSGHEEELIEKYQKPGIYCIKVGEMVVYVGKSRNMLERIYNHFRSILNTNLTKTKKYVILREIMNAGYVINFDVLQDCSGMTDDELGEIEGEYIRAFNTDLNQQIPLKGDYKHWTINKRAKYITAKEIIGRYERYYFR